MNPKGERDSDHCLDGESMRNLKLVLEYDGSAYSGWQRQINGLSVQQVLEEAIGQVTQEEVRVVGSGRTDAGVHALHQVAHCRLRSRLPVRNLLMGINGLLPPDVVCLSLDEVSPAFHARFDALRKTYLYQICNRSVRTALQRQYAWFVWTPLSITAMRAAAAVLLGEHDFSSFCSSHTDSSNRVRTIYSLSVEEEGSEGTIVVSIEADGFLRYMVRTIVGALVEAGQGKVDPSELQEILKAKDRRCAGFTAPPQGLFLKDVIYP